MLLHRSDKGGLLPASWAAARSGCGRKSIRRVQILVLLLALPLAFLGYRYLDRTLSGVAGRSTGPAGSASSTHQPFGGSPSAGQADCLEEPAEIPGSRLVRTTLGSGGTLAAALERIGIQQTLQHQIVNELSPLLDLRRLPQQTGITAVLDAQDLPHRVAIRAETGRFLRLSLLWESQPAPEIEVEWIELPAVITVERAGGIVHRSVAQALSADRHGLQLTHAFSDIFQWDIDLLVDPRPGDRVGIVYEAESLGQVPSDIPQFGAAPSEPGQFLRIGRVLAASYDGMMARSMGFWVGDSPGTGSYYDDAGLPLRKTFLKSPLNYRRISSGFSPSRRHPVTRKLVPHHGIDFAADTGTPVVATADGIVSSAGWDGPLGKAVRLKHGSTYETIYGHLSGFAKGVRRGAEVRQNQVIGYVGSTGRATGPHLHYTLRVDGRAINPSTIKNPPAEPLSPELHGQLAKVKELWLPVLRSISSGPEDYELAGTPQRTETEPFHGL